MTQNLYYSVKNPLLGVVCLLTTGGLISVRPGRAPVPRLPGPPLVTPSPATTPAPSPLPCASLLDHLVRLEEDRRRNGEPQGQGGFEVDDEHELHRLLHGKIGGLCSFEDFIDVSGGTPV